jgi:hypothetical protein
MKYKNYKTIYLQCILIYSYESVGGLNNICLPGTAAWLFANDKFKEL